MELKALRKRKSSLKAEGLDVKRKASFQTSEMTKENSKGNLSLATDHSITLDDSKMDIEAMVT